MMREYILQREDSSKEIYNYDLGVLIHGEMTRMITYV